MIRRLRLLALPMLLGALAAVPSARSDEKPAAPPVVRLNVTVSGLRSDRGSVVLALFRGGAGFPNDGKKAVAHATVRVGPGKTAEAAFPDLPPGEYALSLFHDENNNGRLDTSAFGFPREGFGTSNDPKVRLGPPRWKDAKFSVLGGTGGQTVSIKMRYL
jgi:uncharacterized protein (DUF2141 family)